MRHLPLLFALLVVAFGISLVPGHLVSRTALNPDFAHFESSHVHPLAMTPDGSRLLVVNTPDSRLSVFDATGPSLVRIAEIPVGMEPVSVAVRGNSEAWVVNNLSDDVSVVDLATLHTRATLRVGDEPSDVVFAGTPARAYVSVSQEDAVKSYDPDNLAAAPVVIPINGRMPRALARTLDGSEVLVDVFNSSAQATVLSAAEVGDSMPPPDPPMSPSLPPAPAVGLIVKKNGAGNWVDPSGKIWNSKIPYQEQLVELVYISTATNAVESARGDIATVLMGLAINPSSGAAAVTGTYAILEKRFEPNLRGHFTEQRLAIVPSRLSARTEVQLNPHIDYSVTPGTQSERDSSLGLPTGVCWSPDGQRVFVASLATNKIGVLSPSGAILARVAALAGPTGVLADPSRPRLYVVGRFHNQVQTLSTANFSSLGITPIGFDPTPDEIVNGRKFFYGGFTSGHGDQACGSCHLFGDFDNLAWDLGNPQGTMTPVPSSVFDPQPQDAHPMKGPMVTQSLRGLPNTGVLHWRGDRANHGDDERGDEEEECDGEECGEVEGRRSARLREYALEWPDEWLGDPVKTRYQRLVRVRTEELQDEAKQQQDLEHGEEERDHAGHRPHRVVRRDRRCGRADVHIRPRRRDRRVRTLDDAFTLVAIDALGRVVIVSWC